MRFAFVCRANEILKLALLGRRERVRHRAVEFVLGGHEAKRRGAWVVVMCAWQATSEGAQHCSQSWWLEL